MHIGIAMLNPNRTWGEASQLAETYGVSRQTVYEIAGQTEQLLLSGLEPGQHGPVVGETEIVVDRNRLVRSTLQLTEAGVSQRGIANCLAEMLDTQVSPSWVKARLAELEAAAAAVNARWQPAVGELLAGDELYAYGPPELLVVGNDSLYLYALTAQPQRDGDTWGCVLLEMPDSPQLASDAGTGLAAGVVEAGYAHQLDWDHLLRPLWRQDAQLERRAYAALAAVEERERQFEQTHTEKRLRQHLTQWEKLCHKAEEAIRRYDQFHVLARQVDAEFAMIDVTTGQLRDPAASAARLAALGEQIKALPGRACHTLGTHLVNWATYLVSYLPRLARALAPLYDAFGQPAVQALSRIWQVEADLKRGHLSVSQRRALERIWHTSLDHAARLLGARWFEAWETLSAVLGRIWRGSMAAECVNSLLRPVLNARKHVDQGALELFRFLHNTHIFDRGTRAGASPAELVGIPLPEDRFTLLGLDPKVSI
jgi:hypothetical protein